MLKGNILGNGMTGAENVKGMSIAAIDPSQPVPDQFDLVCDWCGYSLVGLTTDRCPECGERFDPNALPVARIPWLFRRNQGYLTAYIKTVWMIIHRPTAFAREMSRPVRICAADARSFRALTIRLTMAVAILGMVTGLTCFLLAQAAVLRSFSWLSPREFVQIVWTLMASVVAIWVFLWLATDLPTFIWRGLPAAPQDLAPLHHYACAPLALAPLVLLGSIVFGVIWYMNGPPVEAVGTAIIACFWGLVLLLPLLWWTPIYLMRGGSGCGIRRQIGLGLYLPFHWALIALGSLILIGVLTMPVH